MTAIEYRYSSHYLARHFGNSFHIHPYELYPKALWSGVMAINFFSLENKVLTSILIGCPTRSALLSISEFKPMEKSERDITATETFKMIYAVVYECV